jgi:hypothetical protein
MRRRREAELRSRPRRIRQFLQIAVPARRAGLAVKIPDGAARPKEWGASVRLREELFAMRTLLLAVLLGCSIPSSIGCIVPAYSADPVRRAQQLIWSSEDLRHLLDDWERIWMLDMPSHLTPYRTHGGII